MAVNQGMSFIDYPWRFAMVPQPEVETRLWQDVANGGAAAINVHGTFEQEDRSALDTARPIFHWLKEFQRYYVGQYPEARVLLLGGGRFGFDGSQPAHRGIFRLLTEEHIPFGTVDNLDWLGKRDVDLVVADGEVPKELEPWVRAGGHLLIASTTVPPFDMGKVVKRWIDPDGAYFRVRDKAMFPSLKETNLLFMFGDFVEVKAKSPITFIPPSMYGPPELVHVDWKDTDAPGLVMKDFGKGEVVWLPWDLGSLYDLRSSEAHAALMHDLIDHLLPNGRQLKTNAHPLVSITLMRHGDSHLVQFVNLSGHSDIAYFKPVPMKDINVEVKGVFHSARAIRTGRDLPISQSGGYAEFTLPSLNEYELVELH
jgi:hypothetical protein